MSNALPLSTTNSLVAGGPRIDTLPESPDGAVAGSPGPVIPPTGGSRTSAFLRQLALAYARKLEGAATNVSSHFGGSFGAPTSAPSSSGLSFAATSITPATAVGAVTGLGQPPPTQDPRQLLAAAARQEGVPSALLAAVVEQESGFDPKAVSPAGAKGLTQLMDGTARDLGVTDPFDPWQSLVGGARFLRAMLDRYHGDPRLAAAAYNAGPGAVDKYAGVPPYAETQTYVRRVLSLYGQYASGRTGG